MKKVNSSPKSRSRGQGGGGLKLSKELKLKSIPTFQFVSEENAAIRANLSINPNTLMTNVVDGGAAANVLCH